jgi:2-amino-4-hydroxy-6-hydroxymethyldihydropteridine diphosphokinase
MSNNDASLLQRPPYTAWLGLGSNLFDRASLLRSAVAELAAIGSVQSISSLWETAPVGIEDQPPFLNAALALQTSLTPIELLEEALRIERSHGRDRTQNLQVHKGPRTLDLDILLMASASGQLSEYGQTLVLPHPGLHLRRFVLAPLAEIAPTILHPALQKSMSELLRDLPWEGPNHPDCVVYAGPLKL